MAHVGLSSARGIASPAAWQVVVCVKFSSSHTPREHARSLPRPWQFQPGHPVALSGPHGSRNATTLALDKIDAGQDILTKMVEAAKGGNMCG